MTNQTETLLIPARGDGHQRPLALNNEAWAHAVALSRLFGGFILSEKFLGKSAVRYFQQGLCQGLKCAGATKVKPGRHGETEETRLAHYYSAQEHRDELDGLIAFLAGPASNGVQIGSRMTERASAARQTRGHKVAI
jgi:hypothetical protein